MTAKFRTSKHGSKYLSHDEILAEEMKDPAFRSAYTERRYVQEIARAVRSMRESAGLSQADLAAMVNMKQPAIARLETSQVNTPQWRTLNRIALALGKQLSFDLGDVDLAKPLVRIRDAKSRSSSRTLHEAAHGGSRTIS
jgi:transcriptional regulator with XRE-family HTH domain